MNILVISDTHGHTGSAEKVINAESWDHVVHLGDTALDAVALAADLGIDVVALRGNNEYPDSPVLDDELIFDAGGVKFYAIHGHELDINPWDGKMEEALTELAQKAEEAGARVALFGHTHQPMIREVDGILLVNPGGLGLGDKKKTYAVVSVSDGGEVSARVEQI
jgi:putative phosphoesterase